MAFFRLALKKRPKVENNRFKKTVLQFLYKMRKTKRRKKKELRKAPLLYSISDDLCDFQDIPITGNSINVCGLQRESANSRDF